MFSLKMLQEYQGGRCTIKVIYDERFRKVYSSDPAAAPGRIESIYDELRGHYEFVTPEPAAEEDLRLVHRENHINSVKRRRRVYEVAVLAVGGAIRASELAMKGEPAFGLIRRRGITPAEIQAGASANGW